MPDEHNQLPSEPQVPHAEPAAAPEPAADTSLPEDLRVPWSWADLLLFLIVGIGSLLFWTTLTGAGLALLGFPPGDPRELLEQNPALYTGVSILTQMLWYATLLAYLYLVIGVLRRARFWRVLGWRAPQAGGLGAPAAYLLFALGGMVFAAVIQFVHYFIGREGPLPIEELFRTRESVLLLMGMGLLVAPLVEETLFRGFLYPVLARSWGRLAGVVFTGGLFGLAHAAQLWGGWPQIALLVVVGVVFTAVRAHTGSVAASYFLHLGYNAFLFTGFYIATDGFRQLPGAS